MLKQDQPTILGDTIIAAVSSKRDGNLSLHSGLDHEHVPMYRRAWLASLGISMSQTAVMRVNTPERWDIMHDAGLADCGKGTTHLEDAIIADALVTNQPGVALFLLTADCNPIILHDPAARVLALVHGGWQSTDVRLAEKVINHMRARYHSNPKDIMAYIGPAIKKESYVRTQVSQADDPAWQPFLSQTENKNVMVDVPGYNRQQLLDAGVHAEHIEICPTDTAADFAYFSHYRAARSGDPADDGRFATVCMLR